MGAFKVMVLVAHAKSLETYMQSHLVGLDQISGLLGFSYLSEVEARSLLNLGEKHLDHQIGKNRTGLPF